MPAVHASPRVTTSSTSTTATVVAKSHDEGALQAKLRAASNNDSTTTLPPPVSKLSVRDPESGKALRLDNLNGLVDFKDGSGRIECRAFVAWALSAAAKSNNNPQEINFDLIKDKSAIRENIKSDVESTYKKMVFNASDVEIFSENRFGEYVRFQFYNMLSNGDVFLQRHISTGEHAMALSFCIESGGKNKPPRYLVKLYDPNRTFIQKEVVFSSLEEIQGDYRLSSLVLKGESVDQRWSYIQDIFSDAGDDAVKATAVVATSVLPDFPDANDVHKPYKLFLDPRTEPVTGGIDTLVKLANNQVLQQLIEDDLLPQDLNNSISTRLWSMLDSGSNGQVELFVDFIQQLPPSKQQTLNWSDIINVNLEHVLKKGHPDTAGFLASAANKLASSLNLSLDWNSILDLNTLLEQGDDKKIALLSRFVSDAASTASGADPLGLSPVLGAVVYNALGTGNSATIGALSSFVSALPLEQLQALDWNRVLFHQEDETAGLFYAIQEGNAAAINALSGLSKSLPRSVKAMIDWSQLPAAMVSDNDPALYFALAEGHATVIKAVEGLFAEIPLAQSSSAAFEGLLSMESEDGDSGLARAQEKNHLEAIKAYQQLETEWERVSDPRRVEHSLPLQGAVEPVTSASAAGIHRPDLATPGHVMVSGKTSMVKHGKAMVERRFETFPGTAVIMPVRIVDEKNNVRAWELGKDFLLFTAGKPSEVLLISSHGAYSPWSSDIKVPEDSKLAFLSPHKAALLDPGIGKTMYAQSPYFATVTQNEVEPISPSAHGTSVKTVTGSHKAAHIKNYSLSKFQTEKKGRESYDIIKNAMVLVRDNKIIARDNPEFAKRMAFDTSFPTRDVLTVRNRVGISSPSLRDLYSELERVGIKYKIVEHVHCRNNQLSVFHDAYDLSEDRLIPGTPSFLRGRDTRSGTPLSGVHWPKTLQANQSEPQSEAEQLRVALAQPLEGPLQPRTQTVAAPLFDPADLDSFTGQMSAVAALFEAGRAEEALKLLSEKTYNGRYAMFSWLADQLPSDPAQSSSNGYLLNLYSLELLHAVAEKAGANGVAEKLVTLLRSPDHQKVALKKRPGYYQEVLASKNQPLMAELQRVLQALERQVHAGNDLAVDKSLSKMLQAVNQSMPETGETTASPTKKHSLGQLQTWFKGVAETERKQEQAEAAQIKQAREQRQAENALSDGERAARLQQQLEQSRSERVAQRLANAEGSEMQFYLGRQLQQLAQKLSQGTAESAAQVLSGLSQPLSAQSKERLLDHIGQHFEGALDPMAVDLAAQSLNLLQAVVEQQPAAAQAVSQLLDRFDQTLHQTIKQRANNVPEVAVTYARLLNSLVEVTGMLSEKDAAMVRQKQQALGKVALEMHGKQKPAQPQGYIATLLTLEPVLNAKQQDKIAELRKTTPAINYFQPAPAEVMAQQIGQAYQRQLQQREAQIRTQFEHEDSQKIDAVANATRYALEHEQKLLQQQLKRDALAGAMGSMLGQWEANIATNQAIKEAEREARVATEQQLSQLQNSSAGKQEEEYDLLAVANAFVTNTAGMAGNIISDINHRVEVRAANVDPQIRAQAFAEVAAPVNHAIEATKTKIAALQDRQAALAVEQSNAQLSKLSGSIASAMRTGAEAMRGLQQQQQQVLRQHQVSSARELVERNHASAAALNQRVDVVNSQLAAAVQGSQALQNQRAQVALASTVAASVEPVAAKTEAKPAKPAAQVSRGADFRRQQTASRAPKGKKQMLAG